MNSVAHFVILSNGWKRHVIAFLAGVIGTLALAPIGFFPAFIVSMMVSVWLIDGSHHTSIDSSAHRRINVNVLSLLQAGISGWFLGFGYFLAGLWWLGAAFLVEADKFAWALPLGIIGLPAFISLFTSLGFVLARLLWIPGALRIFALTLGLCASEWLRGHLFTGFPWNDFGMVLGTNLALAQTASIGGLGLLTFLSILLFSAPVLLFEKSRSSKFLLWFCLFIFTALAAFGLWRVQQPASPVFAKVKLRLVQANLPNSEKFSPTMKEKLVADYLAISDQATSPQTSGVGDVTHLIWPESPFPFILSREIDLFEKITKALPRTTYLITGAVRIGKSTPNNPYPLYNSLEVINSNGNILASYDKIHLVPFGEYLPLASLIKSIGLETFATSAFTSGTRRHLISVPGLPEFLPLICYEAIFSDAAFSDDRARAQFILNITNDSWFGLTAGPYQHLAMARLRSIEQGLALVRSADSGISVITDAYGRYINYLQLGVDGVIDGQLPRPIEPTFFVKFGNYLLISIWIIVLFSLSVGYVRI